MFSLSDFADPLPSELILALLSPSFRAARRESVGGGSTLWYLSAVSAGLLVPCLIVLGGLAVALLESRGFKQSPVPLGRYLNVPLGSTLLERSPLVQLTWLVAIGLFLAILFSIAIWVHRRGADARSRAITHKLHRDLLQQSLRRAEIEGAIAQRSRVQGLIEQRLPELGRGLSAWWRAIPRSVLVIVGCVTVALLVNIPLASLAVVSGLLLWQLFRSLRESGETEISTWEAPRSRRRLIHLLSQAPLLARTQASGAAATAFDTELEALYRRIESTQANRARLWPLMTLATSVAIGLLLLGLGVNLFDEGSGLSIPSAMVLALSLVGAVAGAKRLTEAVSESGLADDAARHIYQYLKIVDDAPPSEQRVGLAGLREQVQMVDVTLGDPAGGVILGNVNLQLRPGSLVALLGTNPVSTLSLAELILGIGRPSLGRITIDGLAIRDIHPRSLAKNVIWVGADGPLCDGTVIENITGGNPSVDPHDVMEITRQLGIYDSLVRLPDGLQTAITAGDERLASEERYAIGIARALLHRPPIIVVEEPPPPSEVLASDHSLAVLRKLVEANSLVIILPRRLPTLRAADRVLLLNGPKLAGEGTHNDLLQSSDLYRHLNYLLFNPYRETR